MLIQFGGVQVTTSRRLKILRCGPILNYNSEFQTLIILTSDDWEVLLDFKILRVFRYTLTNKEGFNILS